MSKDVIIDRAIASAPAGSYLGAWLAGIPIQSAVAVLTGILVTCQIVKVVLELNDRRVAKRKELSVCPSATD